MALTALDTDRAVTVSVVICAYTEARWDELVAGVRSVQLQDPPTPEVIVVIDHNEALLDRARREISGIKVTVNTGREGAVRSAERRRGRGDRRRRGLPRRRCQSRARMAVAP